MSGYTRDPRWLTARFESKCCNKQCNATIKKGENAFYYPSDKTIYCAKEECGQQHSRQFNAAAQDEAFYNGGY